MAENYVPLGLAHPSTFCPGKGKRGRIIRALSFRIERVGVGFLLYLYLFLSFFIFSESNKSIQEPPSKCNYPSIRNQPAHPQQQWRFLSQRNSGHHKRAPIPRHCPSITVPQFQRHAPYLIIPKKKILGSSTSNSKTYPLRLEKRNIIHID